LKLEQAIDGSTDVDYRKDVVTSLTNSKKILQGVLDGQETEIGKFWVTGDEETIAILKKSIIDLENLMALADQRWEARHQTTVVEQPVFESDSMDAEVPAPIAPSGPSPLDLKFNASYSDLLLAFDGLADHLNKKVKADAKFLSVLSWISVVLIFVIFSLVGFFMYRILNRNEKLIGEGKQKLDEETQRVDTLSNFIQAVSAGDYSIEIASTDDLSNRLITMRDTLRNNAEEDKRRNWATSGEAQIGEILRASGNITELYDNIITFVVKYTKSNQGGLFILNDENEQDICLELVSCYAFERKKFINKRVEVGQGLVGQCFMEGARIHLREIPADYVHITSGLGGASPTSLLVIPMRVNEKTYGVIELASFKMYEEHEIVLIEKFAESIGAEVSSVKSNESTKILLEKTQQQTEEMRAQEEEMRQNMEELSATQEEMVRKEREYVSRIRELEGVGGKMESVDE
jgi:putative methionine-R-sulfoxide reductase with GAF domain